MITMPNGDMVKPIRPGPGTAPHPFVSIEDAIGDLLRFDWWVFPVLLSLLWTHLCVCRKRPGQGGLNGRGGVPSLVCDHKKPHCGYQGRVGYHCEPRTVYQKEARVKESMDLQHFTKTVKARKVDRLVYPRGAKFSTTNVMWLCRVLAIPMNPGADYRST
jgi:DNA (cytosine-5)-methyltransferase 1